MHATQIKILQLSKTLNLKELSLRDIGKLVGEPHPQNIRHHIEQLELKGLINLTNESPNPTKQRSLINVDFVNIPILGSANCGKASILAEDNFEGMLTVSKSIVRGKGQVYALKAEGESMNKANVKGSSIHEGDYVLVDSSIKQPRNNDYVVSNIDGCVNIKKFYWDKKTKRILLMSESTHFIPPIVIHLDDFSDYMVVGRVFDIIKSSKA